MRMRKECNYRLLVARKCLESVFVLLYFPAIVNAQLCRILSPRTTLYHIYMKRHCSKGKLFLRGVPLFVFLYILYILLSFLSLSLPFFLFLFFFFLCASTYFSCFFRIFSNDVADTGFAIECKKVFILNRDVQGFRLAYNNGF